ncbi:hypothetical protein [Dyella sp.]|uniref:hypothetical protein n=1 Tax=Dyella sp. TaxID=1869338 RepID=UPI002D79116B|nr:hypothetical protein [Dyella sp.]HET7332235.1 hypothetical protein [Dyella sp.]
MATFRLDKDGLWIKGIGQLIFAFAGIESAIVSLIKEASRSKIHDTAAHLSLHHKIDLLLEILDSETGDHTQVKSALKQASALAAIRNLVAHNRLAVGISVTPDMELQFREFIPSRRNNNKEVTLEQLLEAARQAEEIERTLWSNVRNPTKVT